MTQTTQECPRDTQQTHGLEQSAPSPRRLLFLCTGNFYRSRFAETLFNALAAETGLNWRAYSRGLATENVLSEWGPMSAYALRGLEERGIPMDEPIPPPAQLEEQDLEEADLVIALKEAEHRPLLEERFPQWLERANNADEGGGQDGRGPVGRAPVEYWHIHDLDLSPAEEALAGIERGIKDLISRLARDGAGSRT
jgi:protein-tyrosine phosphatase